MLELPCWKWLLGLVITFPRRTQSSLNFHQLWTPRNRRCDLCRIQAHRNNWRGYKHYQQMHLTYKLIWKEKSKSLLAPSKPSKALPCGLSTCLSKKNRSKASLVRSFIQRRQEELTHPWQHWEWIQKGLLKLGVHPSTKTRDQQGDPSPRNKILNIPSSSAFPSALKHSR